VRLGIQAPDGVSIDRREVRERKRRDGEHGR
jgi:sRNA-binding carbon storage regulator CsrA